MEQLSFLSAQLKTPIEEALHVDDNGHTTAKSLYAFLELRPKDYARWCKMNIVDNEFATENEDYWAIRIDAENPQPSAFGGRPSQDYKLTAHFAKKLCMKSSGSKANEAREYFTHIEEKIRDNLANVQGLSMELQTVYALFNTMAKHELEQKRQAAAIERLNNRFDSVKCIYSPIGDNWRREITERINKIQSCLGTDIRFLRTDLYNELESRAAANLGIRLANRKEKLRNNGATKSQIEKVNYMDVIEEDKRLKEIFSGVVKDFEAHYCV